MIVTRRNTLSGSCFTCDKMVWPNEGFLDRKDILCAECVNKPRPNEILITKTPSGEIELKAKRFLGGERFVAFRQVTEGARYNMERKTNTVSLDKLPAILTRMRADNFKPIIETDLLHALRKRDADKKEEIKEADFRMVAVDLELAKRGLFLFPFQKNGARWLTTRRGALLADQMGLGKAQPLDSKILTPTGWKNMGNIRVGDKLIGSNGKVILVTGVYPKGSKEVFRVNFSDGSYTECCDDHLWQVNSPNRKFSGANPKVLALSEIRKRIKDKNGNRLHFIPTVKDMDLESKKEEGYRIDPYFLGALIGDGSLTHQVRFSTADNEMIDFIRKMLPPGHVIKQASKYDWSISSNKGKDGNIVRNSLRAIGLFGKRAEGKFVPHSYKFASLQDRVSILQGLLDTDGYCNENTIEYCSVSKTLAEDVLFLVQSIGGTAKITEKPTNCQLAYRVRVSIPSGIFPFRLKRRLDKYKNRTKYEPTRSIESVVSVGVKKVQCISVDSDDGLYVTDQFIVTHNTIQTIIAIPENAPIVIVCPSVAKGVWLRELSIWRPEIKCTVLSGRGSFRWPRCGEAIITNYEILPELTSVASEEEETVEILPLDIQMHVPTHVVLIADEAHMLKSYQSNRTRSFCAISEAVREQDGRVWLLTGTPLLNEPSEFWSILQAADLAREAFGSWKNFCTLFERTEVPVPGQYIQKGIAPAVTVHWGKPSAEVVDRIRRVALRRHRRDVLPDLPAKLYRTLLVDITKKLESECDSIYKKVAPELLLMRLPKFDQVSKIRMLLAQAKIPFAISFVEQLEEQKEPLVVFSAHRDPVLTIGSRPGWAFIAGNEAKEKTAIEEAFQRGELKGVAATIPSAGVAITLTRACQVLMIDRMYTPGLNEQAIDRVDRIGQMRGMVITDLVANHPLDARVFEILTGKKWITQESIEKARVI